MSTKSSNRGKKGEVLVAILNDWNDFHILKNEGWYRVPVQSAPKRWPPQWIAFYQTKIFEEEAYSIRHFGRVKEIKVVPRTVLFPNEMTNPKSDQLYYRVAIESLQERTVPILSRRPRRIVFVSTTWEKFTLAEDFNDLFDDSPLEDLLWQHLKRFAIPAERQWPVTAATENFYLDFAIFCKEGSIDVETDGDSYHIGKEVGAKDNLRNNTVASLGWHVLRFSTQQIQEQVLSHCMPKITKLIKHLGGQPDAAQAPTRLYDTSQGMMTQLSLLESKAIYEVDEPEEDV